MAMGLHQTGVYAGTIGVLICAGRHLVDALHLANALLVFRYRRRFAGHRVGDFSPRARPQRSRTARIGVRLTRAMPPPAGSHSQFLLELIHTPSASADPRFLRCEFGRFGLHHLDAELSLRAVRNVVGDGRFQRDVLLANGERPRIRRWRSARGSGQKTIRGGRILSQCSAGASRHPFHRFVGLKHRRDAACGVSHALWLCQRESTTRTFGILTYDAASALVPGDHAGVGQQ